MNRASISAALTNQKAREVRERGERDTRGYEPFAVHAPRHLAILGNLIKSVDNKGAELTNHRGGVALVGGDPEGGAPVLEPRLRLQGGTNKSAKAKMWHT